MPRHPRTIYKPVTSNVLTVADTTAPNIAFFSEIREVDADASQGLVLKHSEVYVSMGLTHTGTLSNLGIVSGIMGYFKWPSDAATPTVSTIDLENRTKIFARRSWSVQGSQPRSFTIRAKSIRLTLGEGVWCFLMKLAETEVELLLHTAGRESHYETQA